MARNDIINTDGSLNYDEIGSYSDKIGLLSDLKTTDKSSLVNAVNENTSQLADIMVDVKNFGAKCDGVTDDTTAFANAISFLENQTFGYKQGGTILLPAGICYLATISGDMSALINWKSNINLIGVGEKSVLKVADGLNGIGKYFNVIATPTRTSADAVSNCIFRDFVVDENGTNNLVPSGEYAKENNAIQFLYGENILVENVKIKNNPGLQCLRFGSDTNYDFGKVTITKCKIENVGTSVPNNSNQIDHSSIYYAGSLIIVNGNIFTNDQNGVNGATCAIELHVKKAIISLNQFDKFNIGFIISADDQDIEDIICSENIFNDGLSGVQLWNKNQLTTLKNVKFYNNIFKINKASGQGVTCDQMDYVGENVEFSGNTFICTDGITADVGYGMSFKNFKNITLSNNKIEGFMADGVMVEPIDGVTKLYVDNNKIFDCGKSTTIGENYGISLVSSKKFDDVRIKRNRIENTSTTYMKKGLSISTPIKKGSIINNDIINMPITVPKFSNDMTFSVTPDYLYVEHIGQYSPEDIVPASIGSKWIDSISGKIFTKFSTSTSTEGWRFETFSNVAPDDTYNAMDRIRNTNPSSGQSGWECTSDGTLGTLTGITANTIAGSTNVTMNSVTGLYFGSFITIAGVTGTYKIVNINGTTVTLNTAPNVSVTGGAVSFSAPTIKVISTLS